MILTQDVRGLGKAGEMVQVADGYGRNYLLPNGLAVAATGSTARAIQHQQEQLRRRLRRELDQAQELAEKLSGQTLVIPARAGEGGRLFGSVTAADIAEACEQRFSARIERRRVEMEGPIKALGRYPVTLRLAPGVAAEITVVVEAQAAAG